MPLDGMWNITVQWYAGEFLCKVLSCLKLFSMYALAFMMVVLSLGRSLAITRPLAVQNNRKLQQSMTSLAWILSSIFAGPQAGGSQVRGQPRACNLVRPYCKIK
uniref:G-protein coupled receptors family 1 profile domain-containing protein n=1 Tax=Marmota marmota marmota TaxID=9994 RepID=A0A8C6EMU6_MARMA